MIGVRIDGDVQHAMLLPFSVGKLVVFMSDDECVAVVRLLKLNEWLEGDRRHRSVYC